MVVRVVRSLSWVAALTIAGLCGAQAQDASEREILTDFFATCNGGSWGVNENWLSDESFCTWHGITCDNDSKLVELELRNNELECEIPEAVFDLPSLQVLDVTGNSNVQLSFAGIDSDRVAGVTKLYFADTNTDSLEGITNFSNLKALGAGGTGLTGEFPLNVLELTSLSTLDLSHNLLTGTIPEDIDSLTNLCDLFLSHNLLTGTLPESLGNLQHLAQFAIQFNGLGGSLPLELTQLPGLTLLTINDQMMDEGSGFTGPMQDFASSPFLLSLDVANNDMTGTVPMRLLESVDPMYSNLISVDMSGNRFTGVVPAELARFQAWRIYLSGNSIEGIDENLCAQDGWFFGDVGEFGCDGILCPPGSFNLFGRQVSSSSPCQACPQVSFYGATKCEFQAARSKPIVHQPSEVETKVSETEQHGPFGDPETAVHLQGSQTIPPPPSYEFSFDFSEFVAQQNSDVQELGEALEEAPTEENAVINVVKVTSAAVTPSMFLSAAIICLLPALR